MRNAVASRLRKNISMTLGRQLLAALAQFLLVALIARELGPEGNGFYAMAVLLPTLLANFLNLGVTPATVYYVGRGELSSWQVLTGNRRIAWIVSTIGVLGVLPIIWLWGDGFFRGVPRGLLYLGLLSFPLTLLTNYMSAILQGLENFRAFNLTVLLPPYVNLVGALLALYVFDAGVLGAIIAYSFGQAAGMILACGLLRHAVGRIREKKTGPLNSKAYIGKVLNYGWKAHLSNILAFVNYRSDIFLVNFFLTPVATGIYVIAVQIAEKLWMLSQAVCSVLLPRLASMHGDPRGRLTLTNKGFWVVAGLTAVAGVMAAAALYWLIGPIFGEQYRAAWPAFVWLLPGIIAGAGARVQSNCIAAAGKPEWNMYTAFGTVTVNIIANIYLIPDNGIVGAALATSVAYGCNAGIKFWLVRKTLLVVAQ